jgi:nucleoside-diphosphate-sugar epimerase
MWVVCWRSGCAMRAIAWPVCRRRAGLLPAGIEPLAADLGEPATLAALRERHFDIVVVTSAAGRFDEDHYRRVYVEGLANLFGVLRGEPHVLLSSSTAVYHQCHGEWVDEDSPTEPHGFSGRILLQAEALLRECAAHRATVLRFGGIYGPGRERLLREVAAGIGCAREPVRYTNRIHREDCAGILQFLVGLLLRGEPLAPLYLGVDSEPAPMWEVRHWIAAELGVALDDAAGWRARRACTRQQALQQPAPARGRLRVALSRFSRRLCAADRAAQDLTTIVASISTAAPRGSAATCTQARAG